MISQVKKARIVAKARMHETDTGSTSIQISLLTQELKSLTSHLKKHPKDKHSRRGLLKMVSKRKKLLKYLKRKSEAQYESLVKTLKLKKN